MSASLFEPALPSFCALKENFLLSAIGGPTQDPDVRVFTAAGAYFVIEDKTSTIGKVALIPAAGDESSPEFDGFHVEIRKDGRLLCEQVLPFAYMHPIRFCPDKKEPGPWTPTIILGIPLSNNPKDTARLEFQCWDESNPELPELPVAPVHTWIHPVLDLLDRWGL